MNLKTSIFQLSSYLTNIVNFILRRDLCILHVFQSMYLTCYRESGDMMIIVYTVIIIFNRRTHDLTEKVESGVKKKRTKEKSSNPRLFSHPHASFQSLPVGVNLRIYGFRQQQKLLDTATPFLISERCEERVLWKPFPRLTGTSEEASKSKVSSQNGHAMSLRISADKW